MDTVYYMAFDDNEEAIGLLMDSEIGRSVRSEGSWHKLSQYNEAFEGAEVVQVDEDFMSFFDKLDAKGIEPTYKQVKAYEIEDEEQ